MRSTIFVFGALGSLAILVAACGGGGGNSSPTPAGLGAIGATAPGPAASINPTTDQVVNFTGPGTKVTVSIQIPHKPGTQALVSQAAYHKLYPYRSADKNIRTMSQTSPTAKLRAAGAAQSAYKLRIEQSQKRKPAYVSSNTFFMEFVISSGSTIEVDEVTNCSVSSSTCTGSFDAPVGTGLVATLFLYDDCGLLLSAGSANETIVLGQANNIAITLNGVVDHFFMSTNPTVSQYDSGSQNPPLQLYQGGSFPQAFTVGLTPFDADGNTITSPGVLIDDNFIQIASVNLAPPNETGLAPTSTTNIPVPANPANMVNSPVSYTWDGSGPPAGLVWVGTPVETGTALVPAAVTSHACGGLPNDCQGIQFGGTSSLLDLNIVGAGLTWTNPNDLTPSSNPAASWYGGSTWNLEIGAPPTTPPAIFSIGIADNIPYTSNTITFTDNGGNCAGLGIVNPLPTPIAAFTWPQTGVDLSIAATTNGQCELDATDLFANTSALTITVNNPSITIQQRNRK
jgi:hypothetical protein